MKGDLDKDGVLNEYEQNRKDAIDASIREQERKGKQTGGSIDDQMKSVMEPPMVPDEQMENQYMNFILEEALTEEEENMLMSKLEQDEQLEMLFDKVLDVAQEFAGSGPVEGPGSGVSDSIPARLSDGEFVFTAKAVEEIGESELMRMMKDAEAAADSRQQLQTGGMPTGEEEVLVASKEILPQVQEPDMVDVEIRKRMMDPTTQERYVRS
mgnify:CR=1 FL=1|jgi:hypothetical protein|tara:strand:+ start:110 stop:742 length:633 start_codon:yes stop_codon:yes gene_type:complete